MTTFHVPRTDNVELVIDGELLADISSYEAGSTHWTECRIYRTDTGRYVTEMVGRTIIEGQYDRPSVNVYDDPARIREGFLRPRVHRPDVFYLTDLAIEAMQEAAKIDPAVSATLIERI